MCPLSREGGPRAAVAQPPWRLPDRDGCEWRRTKQRRYWQREQGGWGSVPNPGLQNRLRTGGYLQPVSKQRNCSVAVGLAEAWRDIRNDQQLVSELFIFPLSRLGGPTAVAALTPWRQPDWDLPLRVAGKQTWNAPRLNSSPSHVLSEHVALSTHLH